MEDGLTNQVSEFEGIDGTIWNREWLGGMRIVKAMAILLIGPLVGILMAFFLAILALPPDPNFISNGGHSSPGDGFLIMGYIFLSFFISVPLSILLAWVLLFRSGKAPKLGDAANSKQFTT